MTCFKPKRRILHIILRLSVIVIAASALAKGTGAHVRSEMLVTTDWLASQLNEENVVVLCIVEDEHFYSRGHIPQSRVVRLSQLVTTRGGVPNELRSVDQLQHVFEGVGITNRSHIILYGERSGILAARAYFTLDYVGLADQAALLDGGMEKWRSEGRPESTSSPHIAKSALHIRLNSEILVSMKQMAAYSHAQLRSSAPVLIDARPPDEYEGQRLSKNVSKAGHIPTAINVYWRNTVMPGNIPSLRGPDELRKLFAIPFESSGPQVITYCRTGMQSSLDYFVAKYLGYAARMYDGSFYEWSRSSHPVENMTTH
jgi:thiosulfate/3-mercaptopyruvate sulfurtransferase